MRCGSVAPASAIALVTRLPMQRLGLSTLLLALCVVTGGCATPRHNIVRNTAPLAKDAVARVEATDFDAAEFKASDGTVLRYRFLLPSNRAPGKSQPLVLQLHGSGGIGTDNLKQVDRLAKTWAMPDVR